MNKNDNLIAKKFISLLQEIKPLISIYEQFDMTNIGRSFFTAKINRSILIFPEIKYELIQGNYFIDKHTFQINLPAVINNTLSFAPIVFQSESKTSEEKLTLFTLMPRIKKYNKHLISSKAIAKIDEIEKLLLSEKEKTAIAIKEAIIDIIKKDEDFYLLAQNKTSNKLNKKLTKHLSGSAQIDLCGNGNIEEKDFKLFIKGYAELISGVKQSAAMLLDSLMIVATENGLTDTLIRLPIKKYMEMRGLKDEKETRKQVKNDIDALERVSFEYKAAGKNKAAWLKVSISGGTVGQIKNGDIIFRFNQDFFDSFKIEKANRYLYMYFPKEALQGSIRANPWKYWLARKISEHKRMNLGSHNEDIISVKTLIDACPDFPSYEEIISENRNITNRIIEPFERDMDALCSSILWEYANTQEPPTDYQTFINSNIKIHWSYYPETPKLIENKKKQQKLKSKIKIEKKREK